MADMGDVTRLPIRRRGAFDLADEIHHAHVGHVEVLMARVVTLAGPETWGVIIRSPGESDAMPVNVQRLGDEPLGEHLANLAMIVTETLRQARARADALCADPEPHGAA
jgi:hypothetical protein